MKIAVTGATGFVGSHVLAQLGRRPDVQIVATSRSGRSTAGWPPGIQHVVLDLADAGPDAFDRLGRPDIVMHLAWGGLPNYRSLHHFESELPAQYRFLRLLVDGGLSRLVVTGTCYEYGMVNGELTESQAPEPTNPYAHAKNVLRQQLEYLRANCGSFALTWARLFYMYGDGQAPTSLYPQLMAALRRGDISFAMSRGEQLRDFLPVEEAARLLVDVAMAPAADGIVNICSGTPISVRSLVERWVAQSGRDIALDLGRYPYPNYEPLAFWGSTRRLRQIVRDDSST